MPIINAMKIQGVQVQVKDPISKKSKSFTVHGISMNKLYYNLLSYTYHLVEYKDNLGLIINRKKGGDNNGSEKKTVN